MMNRLLGSISLLALGCVILSASDCSRNGGKSNPCDGVMCTMQFAMVNVTVRDATGNPARLDSAVTIGANGKVIPTSPHMGEGVYTIVDDGYKSSLALRTEDVRFKGYLAGRQVLDEAYTITADCCHVSKKSGPAELVLR